MDINLNNVQHEPIEVAASLTAALNRYYVNTASATYTDPTPVQGEGFIVYVKNGTATVGGTGYSTVGSVIYRYYHSGAWGNTVLVDPSGSYQPLDADLTSIAGLTSTSAYLRRSAANTYVLDSYSTVASNLPSTGITSKVLTGGTFQGLLATTDSILTAFQILEDNAVILTNAAIIDSAYYTQPTGQIIVGDATNKAQKVALTLSGTGGTFGLSGTGVLTMPNADATTRGLLTSGDYVSFSNKGNAQTANPLSQFAATTSAQLRGVLSDENGTGAALFDSATSPTFITDITTPKVIGGTGATSKITHVASTNAAPTSTAVAFELFTGNNGTQFNPIIVKHNGTMTFGTGVASLESIHVFGGTYSGSGLKLGSYNASWGGFWSGAVTPATNNYALIAKDTRTAFNAVTDIFFYLNDAAQAMAINSTGVFIGQIGLGTHSGAAKLHVLHTTEQFRVGYDATNYYSTTVGSTGTVTFNAVGAGSKFVFSDAIELTQTVTTESLTSDRSVTIVINGTTYKLLAKA